MATRARKNSLLGPLYCTPYLASTDTWEGPTHRRNAQERPLHRLRGPRRALPCTVEIPVDPSCRAVQRRIPLGRDWSATTSFPNDIISGISHFCTSRFLFHSLYHNTAMLKIQKNNLRRWRSRTPKSALLKRYANILTSST